ncbi:MAG: GerW family sporulation protein [Clostridia bacterium]|nr:GerW family sporulation protein [Clostridia bacterium]
MEENHPIEELMVTTMNSIKQMVDVNTIIGEPIKALDNTVIIPISKVGFGFAAGGSEFNDETVNSYNRKEKEENIKYRLPFGGGSGAGVNISPVAFLIVQNDNVKLIEASHSSVLDKIVEYIPDVAEKVSNLIKKKLDNKRNEYNDFGDDFDDDFEDNYDDELDDFDDYVEESNIDKQGKHSSKGDDFFEDHNDNDLDNKYDLDFDDDFEEDIKIPEKKSVKKESTIIKNKDGNKIKEKHKKEINKIINEGSGKAKKFEEKIKEVKNNG